MKVAQKKVCMLGDFAVGKTSLVCRYVEGNFDDSYLSSIGVKISRKPLERGDHKLNLILWDLGGGENFAQLQPSYLQGAAGALIVLDLTRTETLESLAGYVKQIQDVNKDAVIVFAANKADLDDERTIAEDKLEKACAELKFPVLLTSAKTGKNVEEIFEQLAAGLEGKQS